MSANRPATSATSRTSRAEASAWVVRLHGPHRTAAVEAAFRAWLSADPKNRAEFERVTRVWDDATGIPAGGITRLPQWTRPTRASRWAIAAGLLLACGVSAFSAYQLWFAGVYWTGTGEQRIVRLEDGTRVSLNSGTQLKVSFAKDARHILLARGEAYFEVAHNPRRPFIVTAAGHEVTAVGTTFLVRCDASGTAVTLVEGKVTVSDADPTGTLSPRAASERSRGDGTPSVTSQAEEGSSPQVVALVPGERLLLAPHAAARLDEPHIDTITAWRRGEVVLERTPLNDAIAEMNRYEDRKLVISSPEVARLTISGIYHVGDSAGFAETVAQLYHLHVTSLNGEILLSRQATTQRADGQP